MRNLGVVDGGARLLDDGAEEAGDRQVAQAARNSYCSTAFIWHAFAVDWTLVRLHSITAASYSPARWNHSGRRQARKHCDGLPADRAQAEAAGPRAGAHKCLQSVVTERRIQPIAMQADSPGPAVTMKSCTPPSGLELEGCRAGSGAEWRRNAGHGWAAARCAPGRRL